MITSPRLVDNNVNFYSLLPTPEQCSRDITKESPRHLRPVESTDSSPNRSHNSTLNSTFDSRCSTPLKTVSTPTGSKFTSPIFNSRTSTPFNSTGYNTSGGSNLQTLNCSPNSMQLLEKRLVSKDTKQYSLEDFIVTKEKQGKQKKKKRASLLSCDSRLPKNSDKSNDSTGNVTTPERSKNNGKYNLNFVCNIDQSFQVQTKKLGIKSVFPFHRMLLFGK